MKKSVIIDPGVIPQNYVLDSIKESPYSIIAIGEKRNISYIKEKTSCNCYYYDNFRKSGNDQIVSEKAKCLYNKIYADVISDYKTLQIAERCKIRVQLWENDFHDLIFISKLVSGYLDLICTVNPEFIFFHSTPHETCSWTLGKVAESMGLPVYTTVSAPLPWKSILRVGLNSPKLIPIETNVDQDKNYEYVEDYLISNKKKYDEAIPSYEKERIEARKGKFWSWKKEFFNCFKAKRLKIFILYFISVFRKYSLYKYYQSLAESSLDLSNKFVVVFLHYQPERTSLPEGRFFTQQYHLIKTIRLALPDGYSIYVKEHPSMFVNYMDIRYRDKSFYRDIASLPNVKLVDIGIDSFTLLDNSVCIATITGTVGVQAFTRGKSVLCFGDANYVDFKHCYNINSVIDVQNAIDAINKYDREVIAEDFHHYLHEIDSYTLTGVIDDGMSDYYDDVYRLNSGGKVLYYLLCKYKEKNT